MERLMEPRPCKDDPQVLDEFYASMTQALHADSDMTAGMSPEEIEQGLRYAGRPALDGYEYAKQLEANGWSGITAQDIETLDGSIRRITAITHVYQGRKLEPGYA
jgi:hypothetical protein